MKEGDLVIVLGKLDDRVRVNSTEQLTLGTVSTLTKDEISVLLINGDIWHGLKREVMPFVAIEPGQV
jgi:hypothetical protein